tara:strand:- start:2874 stop:3143 length:270 start_codon:yes stop_codon:yes gene_type:complete
MSKHEKIETLFNDKKDKIHEAMDGETKDQVHSYVENLAVLVRDYEEDPSEEKKQAVVDRFDILRKSFLRDAKDKEVIKSFLASLQAILD